MPIDHCLPRRALLCLLLLALLLHGQAGVLRQLLGASHWHQPAQAQAEAAPPVWLQQWRAWRQQLQARSPLVAGHAEPGHHHDGLARHHHHAADATVVALEPAADGDDPLGDSLAGSLLQPLGLVAGWAWPGVLQAGRHWPAGVEAAWRDAGARLPERPPRG